MHGSAALQQNPSSPWYHQLQIDARQWQQVDWTCLLTLRVPNETIVDLTKIPHAPASASIRVAHRTAKQKSSYVLVVRYLCETEWKQVLNSFHLKYILNTCFQLHLTNYIFSVLPEKWHFLKSKMKLFYSRKKFQCNPVHKFVNKLLVHKNP